MVSDVEVHPEVASPLTPQQLGRASLTYAFGGLAYKGVALLSVPILARLLSPAELGLLDLAAVVASIVGLTVAVGTDQSVAFHESRSPTLDRMDLWSSALLLVASGGVVAVALGVLLAQPAAALLTGRSGEGSLIIAASLYGAVMAISAFALVVIRLRSSLRTYAAASFLIVVAEMVAALSVAWLVADPVPMMVLAWAGGSAAISIPLLVRHLPRLHRPRASTVRRLVTYGGPLVPATVAWLIGDAWIRASLARAGDLAALGEYGIAYRIASVLGLLVTGLGVAWYPYISRSPHGYVRERSGQALVVGTGTLGAVAVAIAILSPEVIGVVAGEAYAGARHAVGPLLGAMVVLGVFTLARGVIGTSGSTLKIAMAAGLGLATQVVVAYPLVESMGVAGAGVASLLGYAAAATLALVSSGSLTARSWVAFGSVALTVVVLLVGAQLLLDSSFALRGSAAVGVLVFVVALAVRMSRSKRITGMAEGDESKRR